jgi:hypothetical protein
MRRMHYYSHNKMDESHRNCVEQKKPNTIEYTVGLHLSDIPTHTKNLPMLSRGQQNADLRGLLMMVATGWEEMQESP